MQQSPSLRHASDAVAGRQQLHFKIQEIGLEAVADPHSLSAKPGTEVLRAGEIYNARLKFQLGGHWSNRIETPPRGRRWSKSAARASALAYLTNRHDRLRSTMQTLIERLLTSLEHLPWSRWMWSRH